MTVATDKDGIVSVIMNEIVFEMQAMFGQALRQVILFGSYARGEQEEYSDMDVMVLVDLTDEEIKKYDDKFVDIMCSLSMRYGVLPTIIGKDYEHFNHWMPYLPFYRNVKNEGINFYAS
ncbi:hypothetical protein SPSIL_053950 [Sporomusa silvacetica DSM 10669]|uniref:Polymerase nucleotidyl transferase domain-containing protein n=1 Tax=Sporomusa silvacetica DSM 10669 TaxID=1123289 RepID=A0ABZ3IUA8_9FIRM|nr:nucleotidyltransferase domain-containing protein [Sporomusa silvacetica]OZC19515.1 nucleotidyltransferase domain protein [Sporomusa silvacetica DSM 10669]